VRGWFPQLADTRLRQVTWPAISGHHEYISAQLKAGVRMSTIHQRLRDEHGLAVSVQSFRRYVAANVPEETRRGQVVVWNPRPAEAGEQAQIDYGQLGRWLDPVTGKLRTVQAFPPAASAQLRNVTRGYAQDETLFGWLTSLKSFVPRRR
jgi:hypothetical protein